MADAKLNFQQAEEIRKKRKAGISQKKLAKEYNVSQTTISAIENGRLHANPKPDTSTPKNPPRVIKGITDRDKRKLTNDQVRAIRKELLLRTPLKTIAKKFGVNTNTISNIRDGVTYKDVK